MDESILITEAEKYLKEIKKEIIDLNHISNFSTLKVVYLRFKNRLEKLQKLKSDMEIKDFVFPYRSLSKYRIRGYVSPYRSSSKNLFNTQTNDKINYEELFENNKHTQIYRMKANSKKNIFNRVKSAISSHKIAIGYFEEFAVIKCEKCSKTYRVYDFFKSCDDKCSCSSKTLSIEVLENGVHRLEVINYLPLSGNYMVLLSLLNDWERESFKKILKYLKQTKNSGVKTVSVMIKFKKNDRWVRKRINLDSEYSESYEDKIREDYGSDVRIELLQFHRSKPTSIIDEKHTRYALALGYAGYCQKLIDENKKSIFSRYIKNFETLEEYDKIVADVDNSEPKLLFEFDTVEEWKEFEIGKILKNKCLMDKKGNINHTLSKDIKTREKLEKNLFAQVAPTLILWDIFKFHMTKSNDMRKRYEGPSPFPSLRGYIDRRQREIFTLINNDAIEVLKKYNDENITQIKSMDFILHKKFKLEEKVKGMNININHAALGGAIIAHYSDLDIDDVSKLFSVSEKSVEMEMENLRIVENPKTQRSKDFLNKIRR
ncbi:MAG: DUF530 domain-containing protein [Methanobrevibacter sp.]|jgi:Zn-finger domain-containing protein|nr:DUF530 domain-containing protein [Candidatus Methanovirga aequatorialis]